ncbi:MAG: methyltransferase, partial [Candidatus Aenigmarchaeota archaeon]|nr:methyltransferase [Candidatus Aenigmarchaeota archaeon]
ALTRDFIKKISSDARNGSYRMELKYRSHMISIDVFPFVFPPSSPFSESTHTVFDQFGDLRGKAVLDIGTGTGILAICSALAGAKHVEAVDIYIPAVECAESNVRLNHLESKISVYQSDLFSEVAYGKQFDLIIANLPIVDYPEKSKEFHSLFDPSFKYHKELFRKAPQHLKANGKMVLCHADLQDDSFPKLEELAVRSGFKFKIVNESHSLGHVWRNYEFTRKE